MKEDTKFYLSVTGLLTLFVVVSVYIKMVFPMPESDPKEILGGGYIWYIMLVVLNLFVLSFVPFLIGIRYQVYKINKELDVIR